MELSVRQKSQRNRAIGWSLAALAAMGMAVGALALSGRLVTTSTHPSTRPAVQAPAASEPSLYGECLNAQPLEGPAC